MINCVANFRFKLIHPNFTEHSSTPPPCQVKIIMDLLRKAEAASKLEYD